MVVRTKEWGVGQEGGAGGRRRREGQEGGAGGGGGVSFLSMDDSLLLTILGYTICHNDIHQDEDLHVFIVYVLIRERERERERESIIYIWRLCVVHTDCLWRSH